MGDWSYCAVCHDWIHGTRDLALHLGLQRHQQSLSRCCLSSEDPLRSSGFCLISHYSFLFADQFIALAGVSSRVWLALPSCVRRHVRFARVLSPQVIADLGRAFQVPPLTFRNIDLLAAYPSESIYRYLSLVDVSLWMFLRRLERLSQVSDSSALSLFQLMEKRLFDFVSDGVLLVPQSSVAFLFPGQRCFLLVRSLSFLRSGAPCGASCYVTH